MAIEKIKHIILYLLVYISRISYKANHLDQDIECVTLHSKHMYIILSQNKKLPYFVQTYPHANADPENMWSQTFVLFIDMWYI